MIIEKLKISLMEKRGETDDNGRTNYTMKNSATLKFHEYIQLSFPEADDEDYENILGAVSEAMYKELISKIKKEDTYDSVGVWMTVDGIELENSLPISVLDSLKQYGAPDVVPIFELVKMTLQNSNE